MRNFLRQILPVVAAVLAFATASSAQTIEVTTTDQHSATHCTLSNAIKAMNVWQPVGACETGLGKDTIHVPAGVYVLTETAVDEWGELTGLPYATRAMKIIGDGPGVTTIRRDANAPAFRLFKFQAPFTIANMTLSGGHQWHPRGGGAILIETFNWVDPFGQGARLNANIDNVEFKDNYGFSGGAVADTGFFYGPYVEFNVTGSRFIGNRHSDTGGGIYVSPGSVLNLRHSYFEGNGGGEWAGGVGSQQHSDAAFDIRDTEFVNNNAVQGGGAIYARSPLLTRVIARGNRARDGGGALGSYSGRPAIIDSTFLGNSARNGGAIGIIAGSLAIAGSTFADNVATDFDGGAINLDDRTNTSTITNATFSSNRAVDRGGAIYLYGGTLTMNHLTVTRNASGYGAGLALGWWGGSHARISNSIFAGNIAGGIVAQDIRADATEGLISLGHNLIGSDQGVVGLFTAAGDRVGTPESPLDPGLLPLADNGGPTPTHALDSISQALDAGSTAAAGELGACEATDQRGVARPGAGSPACDIGAFERDVPVVLGGATTTSLASSPNPSLAGQGVTLTAVVMQAAGTVGTPSGSVSFVETTLDLALGSAPIDAGGHATLSTSVLPAGVRTIEARYEGDGMFTPSSGSVTHTVTAPASATTLQMPDASGTIGDSIALTARLTRSQDNSPVAGRPIRFELHAGSVEILGTAVTDSTGTAVLTTTNLGAGSFFTAAYFEGESGILLASEAFAYVNVAKAVTSLSLSSSSSPAVSGQPVTLTARVSWAASAGTPTGQISFFITESGRPLGLGDLGTDGVVEVSVSDLAAGTHQIGARYTGDLRFEGSSATISQEMVQSGGGAIPPKPPIARIRRVDPGNLRANGAGVVVPLTGLDSRDPEDGTLTYSWSVGTQTGTDALFSPRLIPGDHVVTLIVTDPTGLTDTDTMTVRVKDLKSKK